jgi:hypothetical protein
MARYRLPPLLRGSRAFFLLGTIALVVLILYVGSAVYYATRVSSPGTASETETVLPGDILQVNATVNVSNPGPFPIAGLTLAGILDDANGSFLASGTSAPVTLVGGSAGPVTLGVHLYLPSILDRAEPLLTQSAKLPFYVWVNGTYASLVGVGLGYNGTYDWGAPFQGLNASFAAPSVLANGTIALPVSLFFSNEAPLDLAGTATVVVSGPDGAPCGHITLPISVPTQTSYDETNTAYLSEGCSPSGGSYSVSYVGNGMDLTLPGGTLS